MGRSYDGDVISAIDYFRRQRSLSKLEQIAEYKRVHYACANINANAVVQTPLRLYVRTEGSEKKPRVRTSSVSEKRIKYLRKQSFLTSRLKNMSEVEEVTEHPILQALEKANDSPFVNGFSAKLLTNLYLEIVGEAYWYIEEDVLGRPVNIWPIPSQYIRPVKESDNKKIVDYYEFKCGSVTEKYSVDEIVLFLQPDLNDPFKTGYSSVKASTEATLVGNKFVSHELGILENHARPDAIVSPDKDQVFGTDEAARYEKMLNAKFGRGNSGKIFIAEEALKWTPIVYPPTDLAKLEINKWSKTEIANAKGVPLALLEAVQINRATLEAAMEQHARYAVKPRCCQIAATLNDQLLSRYDESGRLFLCFDDPVPESREQQMQECVQFVQNRIITPNEARYELGYPPIEGGDELMSINDANRSGTDGTQRQNSRDSGSAEK